MELIDKSALVAEIERIKKEECTIDTYEGRNKLFYFEQFLSFVNNLEVKEMQEEPVSEDLEEEIQRYYVDWDEHPQYVQTARHFANWQKEQFEKNRLAACDRQTKEEADREMDFAISIIEKEHRQPTFDDAIKYGMKVQNEQMLLNMATIKRKDFALTWKDMEKVFDLCYEVLRDVYLMKFPDDKEEQQDFYEEVLKRFNKMRNEDN